MKAAPRVQIIDYGLGNLFSIQQACHQVGLEPIVSGDSKDLVEANGIILPGVGAFGQAMDRLRELDFVEPLRETLRAGKPMLGICLGMQLLFDESEEFGTHAGLALLPGKIRRIPDQVDENRRLRVPNVGWNQVHFADGAQNNGILEGVRDGAYMYFVHSFYAEPTNPGDWLLSTEYGKIRYCCATQRDSILGVQFHPEKSGPLGLKLFENWARTI